MNGVDFVNEIETKLVKYRISKETFYAESGISTANMSQWRTGKFNPSQKMIDRAEAFFEKCLISKALDASFASVYNQKEKPTGSADGQLPHAGRREILASEGVRILLDADAKVTDEQLEDIIDFIQFQQRKNGR